MAYLYVLPGHFNSKKVLSPNPRILEYSPEGLVPRAAQSNTPAQLRQQNTTATGNVSEAETLVAYNGSFVELGTAMWLKLGDPGSPDLR